MSNKSRALRIPLDVSNFTRHNSFAFLLLSSRILNGLRSVASSLGRNSLLGIGTDTGGDFIPLDSQFSNLDTHKRREFVQKAFDIYHAGHR